MDVQKAIDVLKCENDLMLFNPSNGETEDYKKLNDLSKDCYDAHEFCIKALEELQKWRTSHINDNIKNPFANRSTLICINCDHKDEYIEELEQEIVEYEKIGTVDECKQAIEKQIPKETVMKKYFCCPSCGEILTDRIPFDNKTFYFHCLNCGQALKWGDEHDAL